MLFCGQALAAQAHATDDTPPPPTSDEGGVDPVLDELQRWDALRLNEGLPKVLISDDGLLNEFEIMLR